MKPFSTLSKEALLDALTEYYNNYRKSVEYDADDWEVAKCRLGLDAILKELDSRAADQQPFDREDFDFKR
jgi:hypothetical protein